MGNKTGYKYKYEVIKTKDATLYNDNDAYLEYMLGATLEDAEKTFREFSVYINRLARFYSTISGIDRTEFFGEGVIALGKAKRDYNKRLGEFSSYAKYIMSDAMNEYVRKNRTPIKIPSYVYKANKIVNRIKKDIEVYKDFISTDDVLYSDITDSEIHEVIISKVNKNKNLLISAAKRASISYDELVDRARQLPLVIKLDVVEFEVVNVDDTYTSLPIKLFVKEIMTFLPKGAQTVAKLIMEDKDKSEISKITQKPCYWVNKQMNIIKSTFLGINK